MSKCYAVQCIDFDGPSVVVRVYADESVARNATTLMNMETYGSPEGLGLYNRFVCDEVEYVEQEP